MEHHLAGRAHPAFRLVQPLRENRYSGCQAGSATTMPETTPEQQLEAFIDRYSTRVATLARAVLARMRERLPGAIQLVYDNYNALAIGFGPTERASDAIFSVALYPRWVSLFFLKGASLPDPHGLLKGGGNVARHFLLKDASDLDLTAIRELMAEALRRSDPPIDGSPSGRVVIKSVSDKQRRRTPG